MTLAPLPSNPPRTARPPRGAVVVVAGPPGVGKTHLMEEMRRDVESHSELSASVAGTAAESTLAFGLAERLFIQLESRWTAVSESAVPMPLAADHRTGADSGVSDPLDWSLLHEVHDWLTTMSKHFPVTIFVDDVQNADRASIRLLVFLARRLPGSNIAMALGVRQVSEDDPAVADLLTLADEVLRPGPLSDSVIESLASEHLGDGFPAEFCSALASRSEGNALLVTELLRTIARQDIRVTDLAPAHVDAASSAPAGALDVRMRQASSDARDLASVAAVLGEGSSIQLAADLVGLDNAAAIAAVRELTNLAVFVSAGDEIRFVHGLVADALAARRSGLAADALHRRAAKWLAGRGAAARDVAEHLVRCQPMRPVDGVDVLDMLRQAIEEAHQRGDVEAITKFGERMLAEDLDRDVRLATLVSVIEASQMFSRESAAAHLAEAIDLATDPVVAGWLEFQLSSLQKTVDPRWCRSRVQTTLDGLPTGQQNLRDSLDANLIMIDLLDPDGAVAAPPPAMKRRLGVLTGRQPLPEQVGARRQAAALSYRRALEGAPSTEVVSLAKTALSHPEDLDDSRIEAYSFAMIALVAADDPSVARHVERWTEAARVTRSLSLTADASAHRSAMLRAHGRLDEAAEAASAAVEAANAFGLDDSSTGRYYRSLLVESLFTCGRFDEAREALAGLSSHGASSDLHGPVPTAMLLRYLDDPDACRSDCETMGMRCDHLGWENTALLPWRILLAILSYGAGQAEAVVARGLMADELKSARHWGSPRGLSRALRVSGAVAPDGESVELCQAAVDTVTGTPFRYDLGCSYEVLGRVQGRSGQVADAKESLSIGLEVLEECGARWHIGRVKRNMAELGVRRVRRSERSGVSLTKRELTTSRAAASGSSNEEIATDLFVSLRTVEFHLSNTYRKLGISGRGDLFAALKSLELTD